MRHAGQGISRNFVKSFSVLVTSYMAQNKHCVACTAQLSLDVALLTNHTAQKMKFSIKDFFSKFDQIYSFLRIWSHLLKKSLMENLIFCAVSCSRVACMADFMLKNSERIIQTTIIEHILNFNLHNFKTTRVQPCLGVCFFFMGCTGISPEMRFFSLLSFVDHGVLRCSFLQRFILDSYFWLFIWEGGCFSFSVI